MKKVLSVFGPRPSLLKIAKLGKALKKYRKDIKHLLCHTGLPFDDEVPGSFFEGLEVPRPHFFLGVAGGSHTEQAARIMIEFEKVLLAEKPDLVVVPGDANASLAASIVASKLGIPIAHIEAGLRSFDNSQTEEINRIVTDTVSSLLFVSEHSGTRNLRDEGIEEGKIHFVGNIGADVLEEYYEELETDPFPQNLGLEKGRFVLAAFDHSSNVDDSENLEGILSVLINLSEERKVVLVAYENTLKKLQSFGLLEKIPSSILIIEPTGYYDFLTLIRQAELVMTDSGSIQYETTYLGVQCITVRKNTERPVTFDVGTNHFVGTDSDKVEKIATDILSGTTKPGRTPELWDGKTAKRIAEIIASYLED
jgi:UDP-N-acetylglucosamine 2-epimerase (non-hydrolysing)